MGLCAINEKLTIKKRQKRVSSGSLRGKGNFRCMQKEEMKGKREEGKDVGGGERREG